ncbi:Spy/CpxP family protein refolding chaperone [Neptuniibacter sp.]|uniref:Spy/CpxP family protein refolding chaperone n=1 Tax=Neptuniibacter sp. TaxID=1962643 RepID=UPI00262B09C8|nr:Spy/CpxP family protein refolding chaperone [Neptuniibacter sp.]MCP4597416.1 periplasmic heavy metal sensor [Neptuniibacter sp.]
MRKKLLAGITAATIAVAGLGFTVAHAKGGHHMEHRMEHLAEKLDLTPEQQQQLSASMQDKKQHMQDAMQNRREIRKELMQLDPNAADYQAKLDSLVHRAQEQAKQMVIKKAEHKQELYSVLTDSQKQEFNELQSKWQEKMDNRFEDGGRHKRGKGCH